MDFIECPRQLFELSTVIILILKLMELRRREIKYLGQGYRLEPVKLGLELRFVEFESSSSNHCDTKQPSIGLVLLL